VWGSPPAQTAHKPGKAEALVKRRGQMSTGVCVASGGSMVPYSSPGRFPDSPHQDRLRPASECESVDALGETGLWDEETTPYWRARSAKPLGRIRQRNAPVPNVNTIDRTMSCRPLPVPRGQRPLPIREHLDQVKSGVDGRLWGEVWPVMLSRSGVPVKDSRLLREGVLLVVLVLGLGSWGVAIWAAFA
jgi:hypothetical protein